MSIARLSLPFIALLGLACTTGAPATQSSAPTTTAALPTATVAPTAAPTTAPTTAPTSAPSSETTTTPTTPATPSSGPSQPAGSFDPSQSDAGVAATVTITNDTRDNRNGTFTIYGVAADGSNCSYSFAGDEYTGVAWFDNATNGVIHQFSVTIPTADVPAADGSKTGITDGRVSFDFVSDSGFGTQYTGDATEANSGSSSINVTRSADSLVFDFTGTTWDSANFSGTFVCQKAGLGG